MPEGFSSIDDLKVVIDSNTESMSAGLEQTRQLLTKFAGDGTGALGKLDGAIAGLGTKVQGMRTAFGTLLPMLEVGLGLFQKSLEYVELISNTTGKGNEFAEFKKAIDALGVSLTTGVSTQLTELKLATTGASSATTDAAKAMTGLDADAKGAASGLSAASDATERVSDAALETGYLVNAFSDAVTKSEEAVGTWVATARRMSTEAAAAKGPLDAMAEAAARISKEKIENPFGIKDPTGFFGELTRQFMQFAGSIESWGSLSGRSVGALEGQITSAFDKVRGWRDYMEALEAGEVGVLSKMMFGTDPDQIRKKMADLMTQIAKMKEELASRETPTAGFDKAIEAIDKEIAGLEQKERLFGLSAGAAAELLAKERALAALGVEFEALNKSEQERLTEKLTKVRELTDELKKLAETEAAYKQLNSLGDEADAIQQKIELLGQEAGAVARLTAEYKLKRAAEGIDVSDEKMGEARAYIDLIEQNARKLDAAQSSLGFDRAIDGISSQAESLRVQAQAAGLSAGAVARLTAEHKLLMDAARSGHALSEEQLASAGAALAALEQATNARDAANRIRALDRDFEQTTREIANIEQRILGLYRESGEVAELTKREQLLQMVKKQGLTVDDDRMDRINQMAEAYGQATRLASTFERQMNLVKSVGTSTANAVASAFDQWMRGTEIKGKDLVANLLREFAKLALMQGVLNPAQNMFQRLVGGILAPGVGGGIGAWQTSVIPGMAQGGTLMPGVPTMVGERGPEMVIPRERASVIPNHALGGMAGGGTQGGTIVVRVQASPEFHASIDTRMTNVVSEAAPGIVGASVQETDRRMPAMMASAQRRRM
jgi:hypothetical protein